MALTKNTPREYGANLVTPDRHMPLGATDKVFVGSMISNKAGSGYLNALVAAEAFVGFSLEEKDNTAGVAGALSALVRREGWVTMDVAGVTGIGNEQALVYASDDGTLTLTATANALVGRIEKWVSGTQCIVRFWGAGTKP